MLTFIFVLEEFLNMARKCGKCGMEGHNARSCKATEEEIQDAEFQANLEVPTVVHMGGDAFEGNYKCGAERIQWPNYCMEDSFARKLPLCQECIAIWKQENPDVKADFNNNWN